MHIYIYIQYIVISLSLSLSIYIYRERERYTHIYDMYWLRPSWSAAGRSPRRSPRGGQAWTRGRLAQPVSFVLLSLVVRERLTANKSPGTSMKGCLPPPFQGNLGLVFYVQMLLSRRSPHLWWASQMQWTYHDTLCAQAWHVLKAPVSMY